MNNYSFSKELAQSKNPVLIKTIYNALKKRFPFVVKGKTSTTAEDKQGVDMWLIQSNDKKIGIDLKIRSSDPTSFGEPDLAIEINSVNESAGWIEQEKQTDYIVWYFISTQRLTIIPFALLQKAYQNNKEKWLSFQGAQQTTDNRYSSKCIFVPEAVIWDDIKCL